MLGLVVGQFRADGEGKLEHDGEFRKLAVEHLLHKVYGALKSQKQVDSA